MTKLDPTYLNQKLAEHIKHPEMSVQDLVKCKFKELSDSLQTKKKIYLDTCYWIRIRDAELGCAKSPTFEKILKCLRQLVADGKIVCPISDVTFIEILSQTDSHTRNTTARLCDELSCRVALRSERYRAECEIETLIRDPMATGGNNIFAQVWVRPCFIFGDLPVPYSDQLSEDLNNALQKCTIETVWDSSTFVEMSDKSENSRRSLDWQDVTANQINADKVKWEHEISTFKKALMSEIRGVLSVNSEHATNVLVRMYFEQGGSEDAFDLNSIESTREGILHMLATALIDRPAQVALRLPTTYMHSLCHAAVRYDKKRKFNGNLLRDFHHGTAGVPYFDAMFTEKSLHVLLTAKHVDVNSLFPCQIFSDEDKVLSYLESIEVL